METFAFPLIEFRLTSEFSNFLENLTETNVMFFFILVKDQGIVLVDDYGISRSRDLRMWLGHEKPKSHYSEFLTTEGLKCFFLLVIGVNGT